VLRRIIAFRQDEQGDWIADLACLHSQHVRHQPPFFDRNWVLTESGRAARVGTEIACPLCDRGELPEGLHIRRQVGPFTEETLPTGLRADHRLADGVWGRLRVTSGTARFRLESDDPLDVRLMAGDEQAIPPTMIHRVEPEGPVELVVEFLVRSET
jgi:tellurite resistance-related uncharacterized protein